MNPFADAIAQAAASAPTAPVYPDKVPGLVVHIDGDYLAYYASGNDECEPGMARLNAITLIEDFIARTGASSAVVHNTASGCHKGERYLVATVKPYQGQRKADRKPKNYQYMRDLLLGYEGDLFKSKTWATREADDGIGACSHFAVGNPKQAGYAAIATADKDMRMLPGLHIDWLKKTLTTVRPGEYAVMGDNGKLYGLKWFCMQMLMGDTADNCPGLEFAFFSTVPSKPERMQKVGEKTAEKLLAGTATPDDGIAAVIDHYRRGYKGQCSIGSTDFADDRFCEQAALMWMRTDGAGSLTDFAHHTGCSKINQSFDQALWDAVERLEKRVKEAREAINNLGA